MSNDKKDFSKWHIQKSILNDDKSRVFFHEREVWFASVGLNVGYEQDGKHDKCLRPVIIIRKFNNEICWCVPTTKKNRGGKYYYLFRYKKNQYTNAILSQLRIFDVKRLEYKIGTVTESDFKEMKKHLISFLK